MSPPTTRPRLHLIDPATLGREVEDEVLHHLYRLTAPLSPEVELRVRDQRDPGPCTTIGLSVADLARYARGEAALDAPIQEYLITLLDVLTPPLGGTGSATGLDAALSGDRDVDDLSASSLDRVALVACAALGREALERPIPVAIPAGRLAALGGCSTAHVRLLAREGELERVEGGEISPESARRWLAGRER